MRAILIRTAFNPVIYEVLEFGISIYDAQLRLVAEAPGEQDQRRPLRAAGGAHRARQRVPHRASGGHVHAVDWQPRRGTDQQGAGTGMPDRVAACSGGDVPGFMMVGTHPETGEFFAISSNDMVGWGATAGHDGQGPANHPVPDRRTVHAYRGTGAPVRDVLRAAGDPHRLRGPGRHRGGACPRRDTRSRSHGEFLSVIKKTKTRPWAVDGGHEPDASQVIVFPRTDREHQVSTKRVTVTPGDRITLLTAGGGGHGDPALRDPEGSGGTSPMVTSRPPHATATE
jgi:N-methylhydantoinase B/oxoprolinase/acetone carboxylase alpha subunit